MQGRDMNPNTGEGNQGVLSWLTQGRRDAEKL